MRYVELLDKVPTQLEDRLKRPHYASKEFIFIEHLVVSTPAVFIVIWREGANSLFNILEKEANAVLNAYRIKDGSNLLSSELNELLSAARTQGCITHHNLESIKELQHGDIYKTQLRQLAGLTIVPANEVCVAFFWLEEERQHWEDQSYPRELKKCVEDTLNKIRDMETLPKRGQLSLSDDPFVAERFLEAALYGFKSFIEREMLAIGVQLVNRCNEFMFSWLRRYPGVREEEDLYGYFLTRDQICFLREQYNSEAERKIRDIQESRYTLGTGSSSYVGATRLVEYIENWREDLRMDVSHGYPSSLRELEEKILSDVLLQVPIVIRDQVEFVLMVASEKPLNSNLWKIVSHLYEYRPIIELSMELDKANKQEGSLGLGTVMHAMFNEVDPVQRNVWEVNKKHPHLETDSDFQKLKRSVSNLVETVNSSLEIAREQGEHIVVNSEKVETICLRQLVQEAFERIDLFAENIQLVNKISEDVITAVRPDYMRIMFQQLFRNSAQAIEDKVNLKMPCLGIITVSAKIDDVRRNIDILVEDDGYGQLLEGDLLPSLGKHARLQLGIYLVNKVLKLHWGKGSCIYSKPETGTGILLRIPLIIP